MAVVFTATWLRTGSLNPPPMTLTLIVQVLQFPAPSQILPLCLHQKRALGQNPTAVTKKIPKGDGDDRVRMWIPQVEESSALWWKGAYGSSQYPAVNDVHLFRFDATEDMPIQLTLIDVVLALQSVSQVAPKYTFKLNNCWWLVRCTLLLLRIKASSPETRLSSIQASFFRDAPCFRIPWPDSLTPGVISSDTGKAEREFERLVSFRSEDTTQLTHLTECICLKAYAGE